jgi:aminopeptidase YwaD
MLTHNALKALIQEHLNELAVAIGARPTGSKNNRIAQAYIARVLAEAGLEVEEQSFDCLDWQDHGVALELDGRPVEARPNPFTPACVVVAPLVSLANIKELEASPLAGKVAVLYGDLTREPLMPKSFTFWNPEEHQTIIQLLEEKQPLAIIAISHQEENPAPVFEDGDFRLPSLTLKAGDGRFFLEKTAGEVRLRIESVVRPSQGANVIGRRQGTNGRKVVVCAHFDTKYGTAGAVDNAAGVATLLALAQALEGLTLELDLELVAFNGEDYYSMPGQMKYLENYANEFPRIAMAINIDGVGLRDKRTTVAFFECAEPLVQEVQGILLRHPNMVQTEPWSQGDHMLFSMQRIPSLALTSQGIESLLDSVIHTDSDRVNILSPGNIAEAVYFIEELLKAAPTKNIA